MHEFSLATQIVEIVKETAQKAGKEKVVAVNIEIGKISGVEEPALLTALECLVIDTIVENAKINTSHPKGLAECNDCNTKYELMDLLSPCPNCNSFNREIISGKEFNIVSIEAE